MSFEDSSTIDIFPGSHRPGTNKIDNLTVSVPAGSAVLFRGDLVHSGSAYDDVNHRVHCFCDPLLDDVKRAPNYTCVVNDPDECARLGIEMPVSVVSAMRQ